MPRRFFLMHLRLGGEGGHGPDMFLAFLHQKIGFFTFYYLYSSEDANVLP